MSEEKPRYSNSKTKKKKYDVDHIRPSPQIRQLKSWQTASAI